VGIRGHVNPYSGWSWFLLERTCSIESAIQKALETGSDLLVVIGIELNLLDSQFELVAGFDRFLSYQSLLIVEPEVGG
jgi:hypothetical protein